MDDARLTVGMTLEDIAKRLDSFQAEVRAGFRHVDEQLNAAKVRDEELHRLMKFGLEARESLRESMAGTARAVPYTPGFIGTSRGRGRRASRGR